MVSSVAFRPTLQESPGSIPLSAGYHLITLAVTDTDENTTEESIPLEVRDPLAHDADLDGYSEIAGIAMMRTPTPVRLPRKSAMTTTTTAMVKSTRISSMSLSHWTWKSIRMEMAPQTTSTETSAYDAWRGGWSRWVLGAWCGF